VMRSTNVFLMVLRLLFLASLGGVSSVVLASEWVYAGCEQLDFIRLPLHQGAYDLSVDPDGGLSRPDQVPNSVCTENVEVIYPSSRYAITFRHTSGVLLNVHIFKPVSWCLETGFITYFEGNIEGCVATSYQRFETNDGLFLSWVRSYDTIYRFCINTTTLDELIGEAISYRGNLRTCEGEALRVESAFESTNDRPPTFLNDTYLPLAPSVLGGTADYSCNYTNCVFDEATQGNNPQGFGFHILYKRNTTLLIVTLLVRQALELNQPTHLLVVRDFGTHILYLARYGPENSMINVTNAVLSPEWPFDSLDAIAKAMASLSDGRIASQYVLSSQCTIFPNGTCLYAPRAPHQDHELRTKRKLSSSESIYSTLAGILVILIVCVWLFGDCCD